MDLAQYKDLPTRNSATAGASNKKQLLALETEGQGVPASTTAPSQPLGQGQTHRAPGTEGLCAGHNPLLGPF